MRALQSSAVHVDGFASAKLSPNAFSQVIKQFGHFISLSSIQRFVFDHSTQSSPLQNSVEGTYLDATNTLKRTEVFDSSDDAFVHQPAWGGEKLLVNKSNRRLLHFFGLVCVHRFSLTC